MNYSIRLILLVISMVSSFAANAQATRTWVSGVGDDANPCSRTAPCKTFAGAISKTAAGGEINAMDPGGYGAVTIIKSIVINGGSTMAGVLASGTTGIIINAGSTDKVVLRNLAINGAGTGISGIRFISGGSLLVEDVTIDNFTNQGIDFVPSSGAPTFFISNTTVTNCTNGGIYIHPIVGFATADGTVDNVRLYGNGRGLRVDDNSSVSIRNSEASHNTNNGIVASGTISIVDLMIENSITSANGASGIRSYGNSAIVRASNNVSNYNSWYGMERLNGGTIVSFGNNRLSLNGLGNGGPFSVQLGQ